MSDSETPIRGQDVRHPGMFAPGDLVAQRFRIVRLIDAGGMGAVYEAVDMSLDDEVVVLKTMLPKRGGDTNLVQRFKREAQYARRITHPNVCRTYDIGYHDITLGDGSRREVIFVTMQYIAGETLGAFVKRKGGPLPIEKILPLARQLVSGLEAIHKERIVHRDFKPSNVMLVEDPDGLRPVITDFGLARLVGYDSEDSDTDQKLTATGQIVGSPETIAPEQISGGPVSFSTDIYAFGVVLYQMLTGHLPFTGSGRRLMMARLTELPAPPETHVPALRGAWSEFLLRCLAREPQQRFQNVSEVLEALPKAVPAPSHPRPLRKAEDVGTLGQQRTSAESRKSELMALFDHGLQAVIVCGAPATGKSELVHGYMRAANQLRTPSPGPTMPGEVWWRVIDDKHVFIDPSGEFFTRLSPRERSRFQLPDVTERDFDFIWRSVQQLAGVVLVVDLTRQSEGHEAPWRDQENDFRFLLPALRWLRFEREQRQETSLTVAIQARTPRLPKIDVPILVLFTKADLLNHYTNQLPLELARKHLPILHGALMANARRYRYDFCHTMIRTNSGDVPSDTPCGVLLPFEWLLDPPFRWMPRLSTKATSR